MIPQAVLVETNWVVDITAPAHLQSPQALQLLQRADDGEFQLFVPAICLMEARETVPRRFAPRTQREFDTKTWHQEVERALLDEDSVLV